MAETSTKDKKVKLVRDLMIEKDVYKMFKEDNTEKVTYFRTIYPMQEDKKQVVINIDDSPYAAVQILIAAEVPVEKNNDVLAKLNALNLDLPSVKYVLTTDQCIVASMFFVADEAHFDAMRLVGTVIEMMKTVSNKHYGQIKEVLA